MAAPLGISISSDDNWNVRNPTWERIDTAFSVTSWSIDRGRNFELEKTRTGTAVVELIDRSGAFDPTNTGATYYPFGPTFQAAIALQNPITSAWSTMFRGFVSRLVWVPYVTETHANVRLELVDALGMLSAAEMVPDGTFGNAVVRGDIVFNEDTNTDAVQTRINLALTQAGWSTNSSGSDGVTNGTTTFTAASASFSTGDVGNFINIFGKGRYQIVARTSGTQVTLSGSPTAGTGLAWAYGLRNTFSGNVKLQRSAYAPRTQVLTVIADAADSEFANVGNNFYADKTGVLTFHGREARFDPTNPDYGITTWKLGDRAAVVADATYVPASPPLVVSLDDSMIYTSAIATPQNIADGDIAAQYVTNSGTTMAGIRTWSVENLRTLGGALSTDALDVTRLFSDYIRDNYGTAIPRVGQVTVKSRGASDPSAAVTWAMICDVDISDRVHLKTTHSGGGGFDNYFFVEGVHYNATPGHGTAVIDLVLDLSPAGLYDNNPFV